MTLKMRTQGITEQKIKHKSIINPPKTNKMAIEARENATQETQEFDAATAKNVEEITVEMLLQNLKDGYGRDAIRNIYSYKDPVTGKVRPLEKWMVTEMFKDPALIGKKAAKKRALPFRFIGSPAPVAKAADSVEDTDTEIASPAVNGGDDVISID